MIEFTSLFNLLLALIILLIVGSVFLFFQLKNMRAQIKIAAYKLYFETTRKADIMPQAVYRLQAHAPEFDFGDLLRRREETMALSEFTAKKKELEEGLWALFGEIWQSSRTWPGIKTDHLMAAVESDLEAADERIEQMRSSYNRMVQKYNNLAGNFLLKPIALIAKAKVLHVY